MPDGKITLEAFYAAYLEGKQNNCKDHQRYEEGIKELGKKMDEIAKELNIMLGKWIVIAMIGMLMVQLFGNWLLKKIGG